MPQLASPPGRSASAIFAARSQDQETGQNGQRNAASNQKSCLHEGKSSVFDFFSPIIHRAQRSSARPPYPGGNCSTGAKLLYLLTKETWNRLASRAKFARRAQWLLLVKATRGGAPSRRSIMHPITVNE